MSLSQEEVWRQYRRTGSVRLRDRLMADNDKLACKIAHRFSGQCPEPIEDLIQIARMGLLKAIELFDPSKNVAFSSFAVPYINGELLHWVRDHFGSLKIPRRTFEDAGKVKRVVRKMEQQGRVITLDQAAQAVGMSASRWQWVSEAVQRKQLASLDEVLELAAEDECNDRQALRKELMAAIAKLPNQQRRCVMSKYFNQLTDEAIAKAEHETVLRIQTLLTSAVNTLRHNLEDAYAEYC